MYEVFEQLLEIDLPSLTSLIIGEVAFYNTTSLKSKNNKKRKTYTKREK